LYVLEHASLAERGLAIVFLLEGCGTPADDLENNILIKKG